MAGRYRFARRKVGKRRKFLFFFFLPLLCVLALTACVNARLRPLLVDLATAEVNRISLALINEGVARQLSEDGVSYDALSSVTYDQGGKVSMIKSNLAVINAERARISLSVLKGYENENLRANIPVGTISGIDLLSGLGPEIPVRIAPAPSISTNVHNEFLEAGINQTLHRVMLNVTVETRVLLPSSAFTVATQTSLCLAETIIVGDIPEAYTNINRSNGYVDETDIDDIYDFGATLP